MSDKKYWLLKTEPDCWSWSQQVHKGVEPWDGVRNFQARKFLREMSLGDLAFFYHTGSERRVMGVVRIVRTAYPDDTDPSGRFDRVDVETLEALPSPVTLKYIKENPALAHLPLIHQGRLSVVPIDAESWRRICTQGGAPDIL